MSCSTQQPRNRRVPLPARVLQAILLQAPGDGPSTQSNVSSPATRPGDAPMRDPSANNSERCRPWPSLLQSFMSGLERDQNTPPLLPYVNPTISTWRGELQPGRCGTRDWRG